MGKGTDRAVGLLAGYALDQLFADPHRFHPVAGFGWLSGRLERLTYADSRTAGAAHTVLLAGGAIALGRSIPAGSRAVSVGVTALATWTVLGGRSLTLAGDAIADVLARDDVPAARALLPTLCGRDPAVLDAAGMTRAALESVAENTSDAAVAPLLWGALAGVPGLLGYRAVNTLDAMIGYRNARYRKFGWAAARTDDMANLLPARATGLLIVAVGGHPGAAWRAWHSDAGKHPSPNAGVAEAAMAGALGVQLGGRTQYRHGAELRPVLGDGPAPGVPDLRRAVRISVRVQLAAAIGSALLAVAVGKSLGWARWRRAA